MGKFLTLVILPGLDGTGTLLSDFVSDLEVGPSVIVIDYPTDTFMTYDDLAHYVGQRLPSDDFVLVGESFSGPLALKIAGGQPPGLRGVVLGASFARLDIPAKSLLSYVTGTVSPKMLPMFALSFLLLGRWATSQNVKALRTAIEMVRPHVLSRRAQAALSVDLVAQGVMVDCPTLLLKARYDRLIPSAAAKIVAEVCSRLRVETIDGPHFLLQVSRTACASAIRNFCDEVASQKDQHL
ncbi:MAG: alpha/beta hydrolase [Novosphingobium sp.]